MKFKKGDRVIVVGIAFVDGYVNNINQIKNKPGVLINRPFSTYADYVGCNIDFDKSPLDNGRDSVFCFYAVKLQIYKDVDERE